jgi:hypothetical protein
MKSVSSQSAIVSSAVFALLGVFSLWVAFATQAGSPNYLALLQSVLLAGCLPQGIFIGILIHSAPRKLFIAGCTVVLVSWLFVFELAVRVLAHS